MVSPIPRILRKKGFFLSETRLGEDPVLYANMLPVCLSILMMSSIVAGSSLLMGILIVDLVVAIWLASLFEMVMMVQMAFNRYNLILNGLLGGIVFFAGLFLFFNGGVASLSPVCFFLFPHVGMVARHPKYTIVISSVLFLTTAMILWTPVHGLLNASYSAQFRSRYPALLFSALSVVCYAESLRFKMHRRLIKMEKELQSIAYRDQLTQAYNRHALILHFGSLGSDAGGHSFALLDLDDFKRINDAYGHFTGDDVLKHVTGIIQSRIPEEGCLYRWGGEEFLIVMRESSRAEFLEQLNEIRAAIHGTPFYRNGKNICVTSSFGAVRGARGVSIQACLMQADKQLYVAKQNGKNQVSYQEAS